MVIQGHTLFNEVNIDYQIMEHGLDKCTLQLF
jgi:hypothetical protein